MWWIPKKSIIRASVLWQHVREWKFTWSFWPWWLLILKELQFASKLCYLSVNIRIPTKLATIFVVQGFGTGEKMQRLLLKRKNEMSVTMQPEYRLFFWVQCRWHLLIEFGNIKSSVVTSTLQFVNSNKVEIRVHVTEAALMDAPVVKGLSASNLKRGGLYIVFQLHFLQL